MGRQAFVTRLALGRSPFEDLRVSPTAEEILRAELEAKAATESGTYVPSSVGYVQHYDCRGHPQNLASEYLREQSRRAQNRVSSLLNGCQDNTSRAMQPSENSNKRLLIDPAKVHAVRIENGIGMRIKMFDQALSLLTCICLVGVRQRLQTFHLYAGESLLEVLKSEWIHFGLKRLLFAGFPASFLNHLVISFSYAASNYRDLLAQLGFGVPRFRKHGVHVKNFSTRSKKILHEIIVILLTPLEIHAIRQRLDLVPMWPFLPPWKAAIPYMSESLLQHLCLSAPLNFGSYAQDIKSLILSPFVLWYIMSYCKRQLNWIISYYVQFIFPKPQNPDIHSLVGAEEGAYVPEEIAGLDSALYGQSSLIGEVKRDFSAIIQRLPFRFNWWRNICESLTKPIDEPGSLAGMSCMDVMTTLVKAGQPFPGYGKLYNAVQMNTTTPRNRVTLLSGFLASSLSRHIAWNLTDLLFLPFESYLLRSIAYNFLSSPQTNYSVTRTQSSHQILPLGSWFGLGLRSGGWRGIVRYGAKIGLWWGIEVAAGYLIWQLNAGVVSWLAPWAKPRDKTNHDQDGGRENG